ncbi:glycylpeptide N-tetradecanoyltransferase [Cavenderia fasciculata]|uniref:Glycylpeptide N-tetradecanoyltransferase n=1 Tax=Cavenderia fasciculata TaxID=261658 RepID=F4QB88_CACFS|nr:glycylpeptide N-tetradecanoyltransferase [Cavenderia fasciculata]EGG14860.1 glycylpeptide N-tetradecanoyltransferase [Cavenderia fasciculata]|eukprot:XP_004351376.1 glycylpeptide N-tetradecanoyltransferase [Cavenderia fasciculata]
MSNNNNNNKDSKLNALENSKQLMSLLKHLKVQEQNHAFWDTQPVPKLDQVIEKNGPIETKTLDDVRKEPLSLPPQFEWSTIDVNDHAQLMDVYTLLNENYVEDDDNMFRFDYSVAFLKWALQPPGYLKQWHIGVRVKDNKKMVGFISAIPATVVVDKTENIKMVEINFLCVHKKLREKRLAPVLIKEITRLVNLENIWQAAYTAGIVLPKPVATCRYYHRSLNPKKLVEVGFSQIPANITMSLLIKLHKVPEATKHAFRPLEKKDVPSATLLVQKYLSKYSLAPTFDEHEIWHWFAPLKNVMDCQVLTDAQGNVTDLFSFYTLPSSIINHPKHKNLKAAFSFYNVATSIPVAELMQDALTVAKNNEFDVFNCLDIFENNQFIKDLKFAPGDGNLQYYLYNYSTPTKKSADIGLVLL